MSKKEGKKQKDKYRVALGLAIKYLRDATGKSVDEIAKSLGYSSAYIRMIEAGYQSFQNEHILKVLTSPLGAKINYVSFLVVLSALNTFALSNKDEQAECLTLLIFAVPELKPLQTMGDNDNDNAKIILELISKPLQQSNVILADAFADRIINKLKPIIKSEVQTYYNQTK